MMTENLVNPSVTVTLDGQDYVLRYRAMAFIQYAAECGGDLLHDIRTMGGALADYGRLQQAGDFAALAPILIKLRDVLWAGLIDAQPEVDRIQVGRMFGMNDFPALMPQITRAVMAGLPATGSADPTKPAPKGKRQSSRSINGADFGQSAESLPASDTPNSAG